MLKKYFIAVMISFFSYYFALGDEGPPERRLEMYGDRLGENCKEPTEGEGDGLTTCYVKCGTTVPFYGDLFVFVDNVIDLVVDLKWTALGTTSISHEQMCLLDGQTVISNDICKNISKRIIWGSHRSSKVHHMVKVPANGKLKNDSLILTGTVKWADNKTEKNYVINFMKVFFT